MLETTNHTTSEKFALIMKGGGTKGLAYIGALKELVKHYDFNWYVGTSAGAISAVLLASNFSIDELESKLCNKDFRDFLKPLNPIVIYNLFFKGGLFEATEFTSWIDDLLMEKFDTEIEKVPLKKISETKNRVTIYASRIDDEAVIFDSNNPEPKGISAAEAVRCSMSIPLVFTPYHNYKMKILDGGAQNNYPVSIFLDKNQHAKKKFIGLYLKSPSKKKFKKLSVLSTLYYMWTEASDEKALREYEDQTVIINPHPISTLDFHLSEEEKRFLIDCGRLSAINFLKNKKNVEYLDDDLKKIERSVDATREELIKKKKRKKNIYLSTTLLIILFITNSFWFPKLQPYLNELVYCVSPEKRIIAFHETMKKDYNIKGYYYYPINKDTVDFLSIWFHNDSVGQYWNIRYNHNFYEFLETHFIDQESLKNNIEAHSIVYLRSYNNTLKGIKLTVPPEKNYLVGGFLFESSEKFQDDFGKALEPRDWEFDTTTKNPKYIYKRKIIGNEISIELEN